MENERNIGIKLQEISSKNDGAELLSSIRSDSHASPDRVAHAGRVIEIVNLMSKMNGDLMPAIQRLEGKAE